MRNFWLKLHLETKYYMTNLLKTLQMCENNAKSGVCQICVTVKSQRILFCADETETFSVLYEHSVWICRKV